MQIVATGVSTIWNVTAGFAFVPEILEMLTETGITAVNVFYTEHG